MTINVPDELGQRLSAIAAKKGEGVHHFAVAALERAVDEAQIAPSTNGLAHEASEPEPAFNPEDFGLEPVIDTPEQAILRAKLMSLVGKLKSGRQETSSETTKESFADHLAEKHRRGKL